MVVIPAKSHCENRDTIHFGNVPKQLEPNPLRDFVYGFGMNVIESSNTRPFLVPQKCPKVPGSRSIASKSVSTFLWNRQPN